MKIELIEKFKYLYGDFGDIRTYFAPGRLNLIGEHTDYNGGHVFPCAWKIEGVLGSRITGGGFGGCTVSIVKDDAVESFIRMIGKAYYDKYGYEAEFYVVDIGDGAGRL